MEDCSPIKKRLLELCKALGTSANQLSQDIGKDRTYIKSIKNEISTDALRNIYYLNKNINIVWIVTGEGDKLLSENNIIPNSNININALLEKLEKKSEEIGELKAKVKMLEEQLGIEKDSTAKRA